MMTLGGIGRPSFTREFKIEAVKLVRERGMMAVQAVKDLRLHENVLRKSAKNLAADAARAFHGRGKMRADDAEVARLRRELAEARPERDLQ